MPIVTAQAKAEAMIVPPIEAVIMPAVVPTATMATTTKMTTKVLAAMVLATKTAIKPLW
jgi:hypothetical protein